MQLFIRIINQGIKQLTEKSAHGLVLRLIFFWTLYFLGRYLGLLFENTTFGRTFLDSLYEHSSFLITNICCFLLKVFYPDIKTSLYWMKTGLRKIRHEVVENYQPLMFVILSDILRYV